MDLYLKVRLARRGGMSERKAAGHFHLTPRMKKDMFTGRRFVPESEYRALGQVDGDE